jgi:glutamate-1-semialdehyde 2,1-aminomutase
MAKTSAEYFAEAQQFIVGGVNSPVRAWNAVGGEPIFIREARGSKLFDMSGKQYIDYVLSWGAMILGHSHPDVIRNIVQNAPKGTSYGAPTQIETQMAKLINEAIPSMELIRMTNSGTEATMTAIRLARGYTGRDMIAKFDGCYHGHADSLLVKAGSGVATLGIPGSAGVPKCLAELTISLPYNGIDSLQAAIEQYGSRLAAVIIEPVAGNMGVVAPWPGFLETLRELTEKNGIILIFDEVITGFRFNFGGYQNLIGIKPDLTCLGKIIGGGLPVGAIGGKKEIMERLAPLGDVYQAGTLSGNPLAINAGLATLQVLKTKAGLYPVIKKKSEQIYQITEKLFSAKGIPVCINHFDSMFTIFFQEGPVYNLSTAQKSNTELFAKFFHGMINNGVWLAPSQFEANFSSFAHTEADMGIVLNAVATTLKGL